MISSLNSLECITLFVENLPDSKRFYEKVFSAQQIFEDQDCCVFRLDNVMLNLLKISASFELIQPAKVAQAGSGSRLMFTIRVGSVDEVCAQLHELGVTLVNGPLDRPWGRRTAAFADPAGHVWEIAHEI